jgi:hypothetical protein
LCADVNAVTGSIVSVFTWFSRIDELVDTSTIATVTSTHGCVDLTRCQNDCSGLQCASEDFRLVVRIRRLHVTFPPINVSPAPTFGLRQCRLMASAVQLLRL